ncbi:hypothetical protein SLEP1_g26891 [Rubroshorea leprosula]|uniref:Uncharacterized protein n=1 Tax=Rubroshorea leprosula TaxID=152421 RepID=A0AAV5JUY8_9ROSI|nr:hypothetical protein SLEP1_g26891 [Rubroshorea leprosula]
MLDRALPSLRPAPHTDSDFPTDASATDSVAHSGAADESKTKRPSLALRSSLAHSSAPLPTTRPPEPPGSLRLASLGASCASILRIGSDMDSSLS